MSASYRPVAAWTVAAGLFLFMLFNFADKVVIGMTAVPLMHSFHITPVEFGVIAGIFYYLFVVTGVFGGFLANRFKTRWLLAIMAIGWAVAQLPIVLGGSVAMVMLSRVLLGFFEGPAWGIAVHGCFKWFPENKRVLPVMFLNLGVYVSFILAGLIMPSVTIHWGWRANFALVGAVTLIWGIAWAVFAREGKIGVAGEGQSSSINEKKASTAIVEKTPVNHGATERVSYFKLLTNRTIASVILMQFFSYAAVVLVFSWVPAYIEKGLHVESVTAGHLFSLLVLISIPLSIIVSWFCQHLSKRGASSRVARGIFVSSCVLVSGVAFILVWLLGGSASTMTIIVVLAIAWTFSVVMFNITPAIIDEVAPVSQRAAMLTIYQGIATTSGIVAPIVMGGLVETGMRVHDAGLGYERGFAVLGVLLALSAVTGFLCVHPAKAARKVRIQSASPKFATSGS